MDLPQFNVYVKNMTPKLEKGAKAFIDVCATEGVRQMKTEIKTWKAIDTGLMRNTTTFTRPSPLRAIVAPTQEYDKYVAYGTRYMAPRPFHRTTVQKVTPILTRIAQKTILAVVEGKTA